MTKKNVTEIVATIVDLLGTLSSEERRRVVQASMTLLGEEPIQAVKGPSAEDESAEGNLIALPARARSWLKQNQLSLEQIQEVFLTSGDDIEVIAQIPGKNKREMVRNAYVLSGIARLLQTGEGRFDDKDARSLCEKSGFFDGTNHMKYMKGGNEFTGTKEKGWILTTPGLRQGVGLIKEMSGHS